MLVRDCMTQKLITIRPESDPMVAISLLNVGKFRHLPVIESDGSVVGIVDRADLELFLAKAGSPGYIKRNHRVEQLMTRDVITVRSDCPLEEAASLMVQHKIGSLLVLEAGKLVGIVTETDIFKRFAAILGGGSESLRLTVQVADKPGQLAELANRIAQINGNIISMVSSPAEQTGRMNFTLRVEGVDLSSLLEAIKDQPELVILENANG
jgi:acetoin utilization protein AcuB